MSCSIQPGRSAPPNLLTCLCSHSYSRSHVGPSGLRNDLRGLRLRMDSALPFWAPSKYPPSTRHGSQSRPATPLRTRLQQ